MSRAAGIKFGLAALCLAAALVLWLRPREIDVDRANDVAKAAAVRYAALTGQPVVHFGRARRIAWPDGWEYTWRFRPCPGDAALRVFVPRSGRGTRVTQQPDCAATGPGIAPREI